MDFPKLVSELKALPCEELRKESEGYFEAVWKSTDVASAFSVLVKHLGNPFKPAGMNPDKLAKLYTENFGGIQKQQTLFYVSSDGLSNCAMIWPWGDGSRATVKIAQGTVSHA